MSHVPQCFGEYCSGYRPWIRGLFMRCPSPPFFQARNPFYLLTPVGLSLSFRSSSIYLMYFYALSAHFFLLCFFVFPLLSHPLMSRPATHFPSISAHRTCTFFSSYVAKVDVDTQVNRVVQEFLHIPVRLIRFSRYGWLWERSLTWPCIYNHRTPIHQQFGTLVAGKFSW